VSLRNILDVARGLRAPASEPSEYYQRPHTYSITVGTTKIPIAPGGANRTRMPVVTLLIQAALSNTGNIVIGDSGLTLTSGLELDSGKAALFAPSLNPSNQPGTLGTLITEFEQVPMPEFERVPLEYRNIFYEALRMRLPTRVLLDMADWWAVASIAAQRLNIFWVESVAVPKGRGI
jgi:hypothetical protein